MSIDLSLQAAAAKYKNKQKVKDRFISAFIGLFAIVWIFPIAWTIWTSLRPYKDVRANGVFSVPKTLNLDNYVQAISRMDLPLYFWNTAAITIPAVVLSVGFGLMAAYALAWIPFRFSNHVFYGLFALQGVPLQLSLLPLLTFFATGVQIGGHQILPPLGIVGTLAAVWFPHVMFGLPLVTYLLHNFVSALPRELLEAARVDGANHFEVFRKIVLPLSLPAVASIAIFQFLWIWNDLLVALVFAGGTDDVAPLTLHLANLGGSLGSKWENVAPAALFSIIIPLIVFFSLQRYFVRGLLAGSVKS